MRTVINCCLYVQNKVIKLAYLGINQVTSISDDTDSDPNLQKEKKKKQQTVTRELDAF